MSIRFLKPSMKEYWNNDYVYGKSDIELVDMTSCIRMINDIMEVTTKPAILDGYTGGTDRALRI